METNKSFYTLIAIAIGIAAGLLTCFLSSLFGFEDAVVGPLLACALMTLFTLEILEEYV